MPYSALDLAFVSAVHRSGSGLSAEAPSLELSGLMPQADGSQVSTLLQYRRNPSGQNHLHRIGHLRARNDQGVETGHSQKTLDENKAEMSAGDVPFRHQVTEREKTQNNQGNGPAPEGEGHRGDGGMHAPAENKVAGPEQGGEDKQ